MRTVSRLLAALMTLVLLTGCGQDADVGATISSTTAEAPAASSRDFGDYVIHFNAISTDQLQPEIARTYNITRSKNRAMLNVSIIKKQEALPGMPVAGSVSASANNLTGQLKNLSLREIIEGDAIYYIGDISVANAETLVFNISATPADETEALAVRFSRQFFSN
jgi:predicted small lipoprotein YifL